jgi:RNA polymerase sigma-70 factor (ECF subfamily)
MPASEDSTLLSAIARDRSLEAFEGFYERHRRLVLGLAFRMLRAAEEAEDVLQLVFLHVWEHAERYDPARGAAGAWLCVMTRSRCLDQLRKRVRGREFSVDSGILEALAGAPSVADPDLGRTLAAALSELPEGQRAAVETVYFNGLTQAEAAEALRIPLGTVKSRIRLAMDSLAGTLNSGRSAP